MAAQSDINAVRENTNEPTEDTYSDEYIGALIDASGIDVASATIWRKKAAALSDLVDVSEAGASHKFSDLHKNALDMAAMYDGREAAKPTASGRVKIKKIERA